MRGLVGLFAFVLLTAACNQQGLVQGTTASDPEATPDPEDPTPSPTVTPADPMDPVATPLPTPVPCAFYGIGAGGDLWVIDPSAVTAQLVGQSNLQNTSDLAVTADGKMIVITMQAAFQLDPTTAQAYPYNTSAWVLGQNALDVTADNRMLVGGGGSLKFLGAGPQFDVLPFGSAAWSGDVAVVGDIAYGSALDNWDGPDHLIRIDLVTGAVAQHGNFTAPGIYGLDVACDGSLYALTQGSPGEGILPRVFRVNPATGGVTDLGDLVGPTRLWGGAGPVVPPV